MSVNPLRDLKHNGRCLTPALIILLLLAPSAMAGSLALDGNALSEYTGSKYFEGTLFGSGGTVYFHANVDYAVYAPSAFELSYPGMDPSDGEEFVYAYQIDFDVSTTTSNDMDLALLTIGMDGNQYEQVDNIGSFASDATDVTPSSRHLSGTPPTSAVWNFNHDPAELVPFSQSNILIFTSPTLPEWDFTTLQAKNSAYICTLTLPSPGVPVPEPASLILLALATGMFSLSRLPRQRD